MATSLSFSLTPVSGARGIRGQAWAGAPPPHTRGDLSPGLSVLATTQKFFMPETNEVETSQRPEIAEHAGIGGTPGHDSDENTSVNAENTAPVHEINSEPSDGSPGPNDPNAYITVVADGGENRHLLDSPLPVDGANGHSYGCLHGISGRLSWSRLRDRGTFPCFRGLRRLRHCQVAL
ncbi:hypothetical protein MKEN_00560600 [Mycena kentingensis (nom. inval.)]|nr:hypothetical protein MKEN_00560600 [Mycena kentingensis (nom. inval.)]